MVISLLLSMLFACLFILAIGVSPFNDSACIAIIYKDYIATSLCMVGIFTYCKLLFFTHYEKHNVFCMWYEGFLHVSTITIVGVFLTQLSMYLFHLPGKTVMIRDAALLSPMVLFLLSVIIDVWYPLFYIAYFKILTYVIAKQTPQSLAYFAETDNRKKLLLKAAAAEYMSDVVVFWILLNDLKKCHSLEDTTKKISECISFVNDYPSVKRKLAIQSIQEHTLRTCLEVIENKAVLFILPMLGRAFNKEEFREQRNIV